jgi:hypothetical protein
MAFNDLYHLNGGPIINELIECMAHVQLHVSIVIYVHGSDLYVCPSKNGSVILGPMQGTFRRIFKASAGKFDKKCTPLLE